MKNELRRFLWSVSNRADQQLKLPQGLFEAEPCKAVAFALCLREIRAMLFFKARSCSHPGWARGPITQIHHLQRELRRAKMFQSGYFLYIDLSEEVFGFGRKERESVPKGLKSLRENSGFTSLVPEGRLNLAQDASPGYIMRHD
jgi:hypothetical protein